MSIEITESVSLITVETTTLPKLFIDGKIDPILEEIKKRADDFISTQDLTTKAGREDTRAFAYKIARSKTLLEEAGKKCAEPLEDKLNKIKNERKRIKLKLEFLQSEVRKPLSEWEENEQERIEKLKIKLSKLESYMEIQFSTSTDVLNSVIELHKFFESTDFEERKNEASLLYLKTQKFFENLGIQILIREEKEREEQRLLEEERRRIKTVEEENSRLRVAFEKERQEKQEAENRERKAKEALLKEERLKIEAQERERLSKERSEIKAKELADRAEREKQAAIEAERKRIAEAAEAAHQREELKKSEEAHKEKIHCEIYRSLEELFLHSSSLDEVKFLHDGIRDVFNAIKENKVRHVKIIY